MMEYIEKKRSISDSLAENLNPISDEDLISHLLTGLDSSYGPFTATFMMKTDDISCVPVDDLVGLLLQEEAHLEQEHSRMSTSVSESSSSTALTANRYVPRSSPSKSASSPSSQNRNLDSRRRLQCQLCSIPGHEAIDYWHRTNQTTYLSRRPPPKRHINYAAYNNPSTVIDPSWYFDSGATDHAQIASLL